MMDFLVRRFVKDFENVENAKVRRAYGMLASITGICCNLLLFGGKKIPELMRGLGKGVKSFKEGVNEAKDEINKAKEEVDKPVDK